MECNCLVRGTYRLHDAIETGCRSSTRVPVLLR